MSLRKGRRRDRFDDEGGEEDAPIIGGDDGRGEILAKQTGTHRFAIDMAAATGPHPIEEGD